MHAGRMKCNVLKCAVDGKTHYSLTCIIGTVTSIDDVISLTCSNARSMMAHSMFLIVTGCSIMPSTHAPSHGAGQTRPVNSGKLLVIVSLSSAWRHFPCKDVQHSDASKVQSVDAFFSSFLLSCSWDWDDLTYSFKFRPPNLELQKPCLIRKEFTFMDGHDLPGRQARSILGSYSPGGIRSLSGGRMVRRSSCIEHPVS
jgi:hypothetical protein